MAEHNATPRGDAKDDNTAANGVNANVSSATSASGPSTGNAGPSGSSAGASGGSASTNAETSADAVKGGISIRIIGAIATVAAIVLAFFAFTLAGQVADAEEEAATAEANYIDCSKAVNDLQAASDYLTTQARLFVTTGRAECMNAYMEELAVTNRRGNAVNVLRSSLATGQDAIGDLEQALEASDELANSELVAMRLAANHYKIEDVPAKIANAALSTQRDELDAGSNIDIARSLVLNASYDEAKAEIRANVEASSQALLDQLNSDIEVNKALRQNLLFQLRIAVALLLCVVMVLVLALFMYVLKPLGHYVKRIERSEPLQADGAYELHYLANAYNTMYEDNNKRIEQLREFAERDPLTGISNRNGYDSFLATHTRNIALILIDVDNLKEFNTAFGHDTGDAALVKLANALSTAFRSTDFPCRIESDKFAVIMTNMNADLHDAISNKIDLVNSILANDADDLPLVTLSVGAAFSAEGMTDQDIYDAASEALQHAQAKGPGSIAFYGEGNAKQ